MKMIILAAGQGTRLRPFTNNKPKCLVELCGIPLLNRQLNVIYNSAPKIDLAVVGGYKINCLKNFEFELIENKKYQTTNMVETLFCAKDFLADGEDVIVGYGDIVYEPSVFEKILKCKDELCIIADKKWEALWKIRMPNPLTDAETFKLDSSNYIVELGKKPQSYVDISAQYIGLIKIRGDKISDFIKAYEKLDRQSIYDGKTFQQMYMTSFIQHLINKGWMAKASLIQNGWLEVDTTSDLKMYELMESNGKLRGVCDLGLTL